MNTAMVNAGNPAATEAAGVVWRKLTQEEQAAYGPHSMVVGFAEQCPYCHAKNLRVVSDTEDPDSPHVYLENHYEPHAEDGGRGSLCHASESMLDDLSRWMSGEKHTRIGVHVAKMPYAEFVTRRFPVTTTA